MTRTQPSLVDDVLRRQRAARRAALPQVVGERADGRGVVVQMRVIRGQITYRVNGRRAVQGAPRAAQTAP